MIVIPRDEVRIPIKIERNISVEPVISGSLIADTKQICERCKMTPNPIPNNKYHSIIKLLPNFIYAYYPIKIEKKQYIEKYNI